VTTPPLTDAEIAELVHDAADGWAMPPMRLDAPAWRERVRSPRIRRSDAVRSWLAPLGRAATGAVALTVAGALIAVLLTARVNEPGKSPAPSDGSTARATDAARPTPLPKLLANGDLPSPSRVLVRTEPNTFAIVDLADGTVGASLISGSYGSELRIRSNGVMTCLCLSESGFAAGSPTTATVRLDRFDPSGVLTSSVPIESFEGAPDPRDDGQASYDPLPHVLTTVSYDEGGAYGFVGWSSRAGLAWKNGLLVVDLRNGDIVSRGDLPDVSSGDEDSRVIVEAPRVIGQEGDRLVIGRVQAEVAPVGSSNPSYVPDVAAYRVSFLGGVLGDAAAVPGMSGCGDEVRFGGILADDGTWVVCTRGGTFQTRLRRVTGEGTVLDDVVVSGEPGIDGDASVVSRDGRALYVWDPSSAEMTRIDVATGAVSTGDGRAARAEPGPLAAFGRWLAPVAAAKSFLASAVVLSADQSRVYAIGVKDGMENPDNRGSAGVFVFDAATLALVDTYDPTADLISLAIAPDGRFLYAAGLPGFDERGGDRPDQGASITVFDTRDGSVRRIAGELGNRVITFGPEAFG
jgi:hypothetical protein